MIMNEKFGVSVETLKGLLNTAIRTGALDRWAEIALDWCEQANAYIAKIEAERTPGPGQPEAGHTNCHWANADGRCDCGYSQRQAAQNSQPEQGDSFDQLSLNGAGGITKRRIEQGEAEPVAVLDCWEKDLVHDLVIETERAIKQRDEFLKTGVSTAGHGGSHDTCFGFIVRKYMAKLGTRPAPRAAVPDVDILAQFIRSIDGDNSLGAGALAERILEWLAAAPEQGGV
jgi:hypothetical protein